MSTTLSVIIVTQNTVKYLGKCLESLVPYYQQGQIKDIIIVDGQSSDGTRDIISKYPVRLVDDIFRDPYNPSFPRNIGWRSTTAELVMFLDSDAYLGEGFFPDLFKHFADENVGIVGCRQIPVIENRVMETIGQWWDYQMSKSKEIVDTPRGIIQKLFTRALGASSKHQNVVGPCYIIRRKCLEQVGGFSEEEDCADTPLSLTLSEHKYAAKWWFDAPLYHRPKESVKGLIRQRLLYGRGDGYHVAKAPGSWHDKVLPVLIRIGTPIIGARLALRYRNLRQLYLFPLAHFAWSVGYVQGAVKGIMRR